MNSLTIPLYQAICLGILAFCGTLATAYFTYRQATRVAERQARASEAQAQAQVTIKRLELDAGAQSLFHDDLIECRKEITTLFGELRESQKERFKFEAKFAEAEKLNAKYEVEIADLKNRNAVLVEENKVLATKANIIEWLHHEMDNHPDALKKLIEQLQREIKGQPE